MVDPRGLVTTRPLLTAVLAAGARNFEQEYILDVLGQQRLKTPMWTD